MKKIIKGLMNKKSKDQAIVDPIEAIRMVKNELKMSTGAAIDHLITSGAYKLEDFPATIAQIDRLLTKGGSIEL